MKWAIKWMKDSGGKELGVHLIEQFESRAQAVKKLPSSPNKIFRDSKNSTYIVVLVK